MNVGDTDIEAEMVIRQRLDSFQEIGTQTEFQIRLELDNATYALHQMILGQALQISTSGVTFFERGPRDNAFDTRVLSGQAGNPVRFIHELRKLALAL